MSDKRMALAESLIASGAEIVGRYTAPLQTRLERGVRALRTANVGERDIVRIECLDEDERLVQAISCWAVAAVPWLFLGAESQVTGDAATVILSDYQEPVRCGRRAEEINPELAVLHETSGSTGPGRLVRRSVDSVRAEHIGYREGLFLSPSDTIRVPVSVSHSFGWGIALSAMFSGSHVDVRPFAKPSSVAADLDEGRANKIALTPAGARLLVSTVRRGTGKVSAALIGAGPVSDELDSAFERRFGTRVTRGYGSTETGGIFIGKKGLGQPIRGVRVLSPEQGSEGELVIQTDSPVLGYESEALRSSCDWNTRDVVRHDNSGQIWFRGRTGTGVRASGRFVNTEPMRASLAELEGVDNVTFAVIPRSAQPEMDDIFVVVAGGCLDRRAVERVVKSETSRRFVPHVKFVDRLPLNGIGKLDRNALTDWISRDV